MEKVVETPYNVTFTLDLQDNLVAENNSSSDTLVLQNNFHTQEESKINSVPENYKRCLNKDQQNNQVLQEINQNENDDLRSNVPPPFKKALFWPEDKKINKRKAIITQKIPSVVTSEQPKKYQDKRKRRRNYKKNRKKCGKK